MRESVQPLAMSAGPAPARNSTKIQLTFSHNLPYNPPCGLTKILVGAEGVLP